MPNIDPKYKDPFTNLLCYDPVKVTFSDGGEVFLNKWSMEILFLQQKNSAAKIYAIANLIRNGELIKKDGKAIVNITFSDDFRRSMIQICLDENLNYSELVFFSKERLFQYLMVE
jgi:hypothetical protein